jgi:glycosyltransferase involved in cell wall biosynthesis
MGRALGSIPPRVYRLLGERLNGSTRLSYWERGLIYPWLVEQAVESKRTLLEDPAPVIAPSAFIRDVLVRNGRKPGTITVVPHAIEPLERTPLERLGERPVRFGYVGRVDPLKGLGVLLEALEQLRDPARCELHVFGAARTPWEDAYLTRAMARYRGGAQVHLHGRVDPSDLARVYRSIDALVVPSLLPEAFGLVVLEAFSAGRPVVAFPSGALPELVRNEIDGVVVPRADAASLADVLERIVDDPDRLIAWSERAPKVNDMRVHVEAILRVYQQVLGRPSLDVGPRNDRSLRPA